MRRFPTEDIIKIINRSRKLFEKDIAKSEKILNEVISRSKFLILGGAGCIGRAVTEEVFKRSPKLLHIVDISENNLAEIVRDVRSSLGYIKGDFKTFVLDIGSDIYDKFFHDMGEYDYVLNFSALKHVRSEKDPYTLMRMVEVNILNTVKTIKQAINKKVKKYFTVSTDKATNPVNMMGASKRIMEFYLMKYSDRIDISTARFANVIFSDGSLLYSVNMRIQKLQPVVIPQGIRRYFITQEEAGELCLLSALLGSNKDIFFPKLKPEENLIPLENVVIEYLKLLGYKPYICKTEEEARNLAPFLSKKGEWAVYFSPTDTTGEKEYEEFYTEEDVVDMGQFLDIGVIKGKLDFDEEKLDYFLNEINKLRRSTWTKTDILKLFKIVLPNFKHKDTGKYLDEKM